MNNKGSSTLFLLLMFIVLAGAISILLGCARNEGMKAYGEDTVSSSADTLMTEYYRPLWNDYHILSMAFDKGENQSEFMKNYIEQHMKYSIAPCTGMSELKRMHYGRSIITPNVTSLSVEDIQYATDDDGIVFQDEAVSYMKYKGLEKTYELFRDLFNKTKTLKPAVKVMKKKMECEEQLHQLNTKNLELMRVIDGVRMDGKKDYTVHIESTFAKQLVYGTVTMNNVGVNNEYVWTKLKNKYINVYDLLYSINGHIESANSVSDELDALQEQYYNLKGSKNNKDEANEKKEIESKIEELSDDYNQTINSLKTMCNQFTHHIEKTEACMKEAYQLIQELQSEQQSFHAKQEEYQIILNKEGASMSKELYQGLAEDCKDMESSIAGGLDYNSSISILKGNISILANAHSLKHISVNSSNLDELKGLVSSYIELFRGYSMSGISFSYGNHINQESVKNPISKVKELAESGLMKMVLPDNIKLSDKELDQDVMESGGVDAKEKLQLQETAKNLDLVKDLKALFSMFDNEQNIEIEDVEGIPDLLLMLFYEDEHFIKFTTQQITEKHCIDYEQEYLVSGYPKDEDNLEAIVDKLMIWRTVSNFITIMSDGQKRKLAHETAILIAGITGIEPLIHVTQTLIMLVWSIEEAMVDTASLLQGNEVELLKAGKNFAIEYNQLLLINHQKIQELASKKLKTGADTVSYEQFISLILFLKSGSTTRLRAMDLINGNLVKRYSADFRLRHCVYSYIVKVNMSLYKPYLPESELGQHSFELKKSY